MQVADVERAIEGVGCAPGLFTAQLVALLFAYDATHRREGAQAAAIPVAVGLGTTGKEAVAVDIAARKEILVAASDG